MNDVIVRTESLGGSALSRAAQAGRLPQWYPGTPTDIHAWNAYARQVMQSVSVSWCDDLRDAIAPSGRAAVRLSRSAGGKGLVITTGQQPGLFGGPLMTLAKAITARALADELQEALGISVAPLFWAATDDADFEEAAVTSVALTGGPCELRLEQRAPAGTPMASVPIGGEIAALANVLREACGSAAHVSYLESSLHAYRDGVSVGDAYVEVLRNVLEPLEISVLDVSHPAVTRVSAGFMQRAAANAEAIAAAVHQRDEALVAAGFKPQVEEVPGLSHVFLNDAGTKRRLRLAEASSLGPLHDHQHLSATVLLRPVLERWMLPTATYVGGPGEIAYFAQVSAIAAAMGAPAPCVVPRWSTTIVEPRIQHLLSALDLSVESLADPHAAERRVARDHLPAEADSALQALRHDVADHAEALRAATDGLVPDAVIDGLRKSLDHRFGRLERRMLSAVKHRERDALRQLGTARGALFPHGARQERKLSYIPFLARYGPALLDDMLGAAREHARTLVGGSLRVNASSAAPARV